MSLQYRKEKYAFGWPGIPARWTSSAKSAVGSALNPASKVWYSLSHGILNEIYYPQVDQACTRDVEFLVTDGHSFFSEEKRHTRFSIRSIGKGIPGYQVITTCNENRYTIFKEIIADPVRDTLLMKVRFQSFQTGAHALRLYLLVAPHLGNHGNDNTAWFGKYKGTPMLMAERKDTALSVACSLPWKCGSAGFVGYSDGWQDLSQHKQMMWEFERAENGNVALTAELTLSNNGSAEFIIAFGFGRNIDEAGMRAMSGILHDYERTRKQFVKEWQRWQKKIFSIEQVFLEDIPKFYRISAAMLKVHESKRHPGGLIASLSIPWGYSKGDDELGGYHLVWPRDMVQIAGGLLAINAANEARRVLNYLMITQEEDGHWPQNMWLDGAAYWKGIQMDQTASPLLLLDLIHREMKLSEKEMRQFWPMIRKAAEFLVKNGPSTDQDRWEENAGYSTYTLAVEVAALTVAADFADWNNEIQLAVFLRDTADSWNSSIEWWTYVKHTALAIECGVEGYYVRINSRNKFKSHEIADNQVIISNRIRGDNCCDAAEMVSPDALALVRFGLREATDERIRNTVKVLDKILKMEGPGGPMWYRYNRDGYGEHPNGEPFNGTGEGRPWPLLTGERAHYELAYGNENEARRLLKTMEQYANEMGMIPEQIWDADDIPAKELYFGKPSGAAMPLVWAHAEYLKLCRSISLKRIFDQPERVAHRYQKNKCRSTRFIMSGLSEAELLPEGFDLRLHFLIPARVSLETIGFKFQRIVTIDSGIGIFYADFQTATCVAGTILQLTVADLENEGNIIHRKQIEITALAQVHSSVSPV